MNENAGGQNGPARRMPAVFVSHGAPTLPLERSEVHEFLAWLGGSLPRPDAVLCVSAHWEREAPAATASVRPDTIHDFYGFPRELYEIRYGAPGDASLAREVVRLLEEAGFDADLDGDRGLDHGAWVPLSLMYPAADVPVVQLSVQTQAGPSHMLRMGRALSPLRDRGVLLFGSGGATHNLREFGRYGIDAAPAGYAVEFDDWLRDRIAGRDVEALLEYRARGPHATRNHPTAEHFLPLFVPLGSAREEETGRRLHTSFNYGVLSMASYGWGA